jgi:serine/threonine-protein kinase
LQIARQVAESLSEAHEHGVFHRDLKPDNIFIETVGVSQVIKVLDFGIAGGVDAARLTQAGEVFGTPHYMSPEQCNGQKLDHRTDIYSLACILFEMIEGHPPFTAETPMATMLKHVRTKVPTPRYASPDTARVLLLGLRKDRDKRIQTAGRFAELIGECISRLKLAQQTAAAAQRSTSTGPITAPIERLASQRHVIARAPMPERTGKVVAVVLGLAALALVGMMVLGNLGATDIPANETAPASAVQP